MRQQRPRVYISGPITQGCRADNVHAGYKAQELLMRNGFAPMNPMATCVAPFAWADWATHDVWLECDEAWIEVADVVWRLESNTPSAGADREVNFARERGIPVVYSYRALLTWRDAIYGDGDQ